jgi:ribonuclease HI
MARSSTTRFAARPLATLLGDVADALAWPRSRPARVLAGDRAARIGRLVICVDEDALVALDAPIDAAVLLATPPQTSDGSLGRRIYDPFAGTADDVGSWRRATRVVLDSTLLLAGGRGGIDERLAERCDLQTPAGLSSLPPARSVPRDVAKLVGYVPIDSLESVRDAVFGAGAGSIGDYDRCSWSVAGTGTFRGGEGTDPAVGTRGEFEQVAEARFEVVVPTMLVDRCCRAFVAAHPYEEPAFDVVPLAIPAPVGFGRVGVLGAGGGGAAWTALGAIDPELAAYGRVDDVPAGAGCIVHAGPLRDLLDAVLDEQPRPGLVVVTEATDAQLELLDELDVAVLVLDRARAASEFAVDVAGRLSRELTLPVTVQGGLAFPSSGEDDSGGAGAAPVATPSIFDAAPAGGAVDYAAGTWRLHFDGGSRGNPGPAAYGWVLYGPDGDEHEADGVKIGTATNNVAEWNGLLRGLEHARARGIRSIQVRGDSELVVKQVTGVYKVKNAALKPLAEQVAAMLRDFDTVDVKHVYRADNARADAVANEAMDGLR